MKVKVGVCSMVLLVGLNAIAQTITVTISGSNSINTISPWIYGRNNNLSDDPNSPVSSSDWALYNEAGLRMFRENGGNNSTKYNWRAKLSSHPDWYNNVYSHDWDYSAKSLLDNTSNTQALFAFQLLGMAASNKNNNFNDYAYIQANGRINTNNNWAGGGGPSAYGGNNGNGNPSLYLQNWPADSSVGIVNHWFGNLGYDSTRLRYWNMDNEPEIWNGTHDDVVTTTISAESFVQKYFAVAKAARAKFPGVKLVGPVSPNEWQWYAWNNTKVVAANGQSYPWMEYFIKRIGEEQAATGIRLLDVLDIHFYPATSGNPSLTLQLHNLWFDSTYVYSGANGVKLVGPLGWNNSVNKEYLFTRCNNWLRKYIGPNHKVTFGISEYGDIANHGSEDPNIIANWYASHLGTFANNKVELFTPWDWYVGQWEVLHLYSRYFGKTAVLSKSSNESTLSTYASLSSNQDSLILVVVNRDQTNAQTAELNIQGFLPQIGTVTGLQLAGLPTTETFVSHTNNALVKKQYSVVVNKILLTVPSLSVTLIQVRNNTPVPLNVENDLVSANPILTIFPNPSRNTLNFHLQGLESYKAEFFSIGGQLVKIIEKMNESEVDISGLNSGTYIVHLVSDKQSIVQKFTKE